MRRVLRLDEIEAIYEAGAAGKCPEACFASQSVACCGGGFTANSSITICNYSLVPHTYSWGVSGITGGACAAFPPTGFSPAAGFLTVPAQSCVTVPINVACPSNVPLGQDACYEVSVFNHDTGRIFKCKGSVRRPNRWCWKWIEVDLGVPVGVVGVPTGTARTLLAEVTLNDTSDPATLSYSIEGLEPHDEYPSTAVSLDGLPPGEPVTGSVSFDPGDTKTLSVDASYDLHYPIGYDRIRVTGNEDDGGVLAQIAMTAVRSLDASVTGVGETPPPQAGGRKLILAFPNPFAASNQIRFRVDGQYAKPVDLGLFDIQGRLLKTLYDGAALDPGEHTIPWDTKDDQGEPLPAGIYFLKLVVGSKVETGKVLITR